MRRAGGAVIGGGGGVRRGAAAVRPHLGADGIFNRRHPLCLVLTLLQSNRVDFCPGAQQPAELVRRGRFFSPTFHVATQMSKIVRVRSSKSGTIRVCERLNGCAICGPIGLS